MRAALGMSPGAQRHALGRKIAALRLESENLGVPWRALCFPFATPIYGRFAYLVFPRWVLGGNVRPRGMSPGAPRNAAERENMGITPRIRKFRDDRMDLLFSLRRRPNYGAFAYLAFPRWALMSAPRGMAPGNTRKASGRNNWGNYDEKPGI